MKLLLDTGIYIHSQLLEDVVRPKTFEWGGMTHTVVESGYRRRPASGKLERDRHIDALYTIGRLIRERKIIPYTYTEIRSELVRGTALNPRLNRFSGIRIEKCFAPIERSKFDVTLDHREYLSKGGEKDRKAGKVSNGFTQIDFFERLNALSANDIQIIKDSYSQGMVPFCELTQFELESLDNLSWFQYLCNTSGNKEDYPDVFHIWTAERNNLDGILALDDPLCDLIKRVKAEKGPSISISIDAFKPLELLEKMGITELDPIPVDRRDFYSVCEIMMLADKDEFL
jgi:hypothetical protein